MAMLMEAVREVGHPRYRGILFRRTYPRLQELMDRAHEWYPGLGGTWNGQDREWRFRSGAKIKMAHCQNEEDKRIYHGHEYQFIGFDQLEEFTESIYLFLMAQNRSSVPDLPTVIRSTFNPGGIGHAWVKTRFLDHGTRTCAPWEPHNEAGQALRSRCFHFSTIYDNQILLDADPHYIQTLQALPDMERRALLDGDWDVFAGQFFTQWRRELHVIEPIHLDQSWPRWRAIDYGTARPFVCLWLCQDPATQRVYVYREISQPQVYPATQQAQMIADRSPSTESYRLTTADPAMWNRDKTGESIADDYQRVLGPMVPADHDRLSGWNRVREMLDLAIDGQPSLQIFSTCTQLLRNLPALVHDAHRVEDLDTDGPDDEADALRYGLMHAAWATRRVPLASAPVTMHSGGLGLPSRRLRDRDIWWAPA